LACHHKATQARTYTHLIHTLKPHTHTCRGTPTHWQRS